MTQYRHPGSCNGAGCRLCWLHEHRPKYRRHFDGQHSGTLDRLNTPCIHLGEYTGQTVECKACKGTVKLKVLGCALHQTCTIAKKAGKHACCKTCPDYKENNNGRSS